MKNLKLTDNNKYPPELRSFALTLHFYSAKAYNYVREELQKCLPHPNTFRKWYSSINGEPGYTKEAIKALGLKQLYMAKSSKQLVGALVMDEMPIKLHNGRVYSYINNGISIDSDAIPEAKEALVFLQVGVNCHWKIRVGYFLINGNTAEQKANLIVGCLKEISEHFYG